MPIPLGGRLVSRKFVFTFDACTPDPVKHSTVELEVSEIEYAGIREVLQTHSITYGPWSMLDALLAPGPAFVFKQPLGHAREVKVALSGLFGRFVARAYLERYFHLSIFCHLGRKTITLDGRRNIEIRRLASGDLPDWVACQPDLSDLTVAEAKGCHDRGGPEKALERAWAQAQRIDVVEQNQALAVRRVAVATRWGSAVGGSPNAHLSVRDPVDGDHESSDKDAPFIGLLRLHMANLLEPLGHGVLAAALRRLTNASREEEAGDAAAAAKAALEVAPVSELNQGATLGGLVGGVITRAGPISAVKVPPDDQESFARHGLRPVFVGVERDMLNAAIDGAAPTIRARISEAKDLDDLTRPDRAGGWVIPLGLERRMT